MTPILIIDDEPTLRALMARVLELEGFQVWQASNVKDAWKLLQKEVVYVVVSDVKLPDGNGVDFTLKIKSEFPTVEVIVLTAFGTIEDGVRAIKNGAFDYLTKGDHQEKIIPLVHKAADKALLQAKVADLERRLKQRHGFARVGGASRSIQQAIELAKKVAPTESNVLLVGETGTGKEVFASAIHYESKRSAKPFVAMNCSAFPKDLIESELFGHAEGAFTGATRSKKGLVEEAEGGTLFLDELGEMPLELQAKVLRLVESREYYRVGDPKLRHANVRFLAATNRNPEEAVKAQLLRQDLYYRLSVFTIALPSLRERVEDIPILADDFATEFSNKTNKQKPRLSNEFVDALKKHSWRGNIRELKNVIERCVILADQPELTPSLLPFDFDVDGVSDRLDLATIEKIHIRKVLQHTGGNKTQTAKLLGIALTTLYQKIKDYGL